MQIWRPLVVVLAVSAALQFGFRIKSRGSSTDGSVPLPLNKPLPAVATTAGGMQLPEWPANAVLILCDVNCGACYKAARDSTLLNADIKWVIVGTLEDARVFLERTGLPATRLLVAKTDGRTPAEWLRAFRLRTPATVYLDPDSHVREIWAEVRLPPPMPARSAPNMPLQRGF